MLRQPSFGVLMPLSTSRVQNRCAFIPVHVRGYIVELPDVTRPKDSGNPDQSCAYLLPHGKTEHANARISHH